ncbi:MAG: hypothetical protein F4X44_11575 [Gammaproteobacteria bacterium]|nr:hypothetical protein [Gammaproteobacteria bacterium]
MKTGLIAVLGSLVALSCSSAIAGDSSNTAKDIEALDKLKVIETINVTSSKEIDDSKSEKVDLEVLKILKAADLESDTKTEAAKDKLEIIETINVTALKEIDDTKDVDFDAEVKAVLDEVQKTDEISDPEGEAQALTKFKKVHAKKYKGDYAKAKLLESAENESAKSMKLTKSASVVKIKKLDSEAKLKEIQQSAENDDETASK